MRHSQWSLPKKVQSTNNFYNLTLKFLFNYKGNGISKEYHIMEIEWNSEKKYLSEIVIKKKIHAKHK